MKTEPLRPADGSASLERDTRIEHLLLAGLDEYFTGHYEQAINVWTRVLFFDRAHPRARAYIERARSALAERQRESEELLHRGMAAFQRGEGGAARDLLTSVIDRGGNQDVALALLDRLDRLQSAASVSEDTVPPDMAPASARVPAIAGLSRPVRRPIRAWPLFIGALVAGAAMFVAASGDLLQPLVMGDWPWRAKAPAPPAVVAEDPLPVPRPSELTLGKARALFRAGHLTDALRLLATIRAADPAFNDAERLRAEIQATLLSSETRPARSERGAATVSPPVISSPIRE